MAGVAFASSTAEAAVLHVPDDFPTIQGCIDAAQTGDECLVAPGTYNELINFNGKAITLRSSDGPEMTIIDAEPVEDPGAGKSVVRCTSGEGPDTVLDGFTITGGTGTACGTFQPSTCGAGMFIDGSSPTVTNCIFTGNFNVGRGGGLYSAEGDPTVASCTFNGNSAGVGAGMYISEGTATVTNCTFEGNVASVDGGGLYNFVSSPTVTDCTFSGNSVTGVGSGGGMYNFVSNPTVTNCTFTQNQAAGKLAPGAFGAGGGGMANISSNPSVSASTFTGNSSDALGGGMYCNFSDPIVTNCTFGDNSAVAGGGMYNSESSPTVRDCTFNGNSADFGGGMRNVNFGNPTVINCVFSENTAQELGGGIANRNEVSPTIANCTFTGNTATDGGGMYNRMSSHPTLSNCVLWGNTPDQIIDVDGAVTTVSYSNVQGGWQGDGNIDLAPRFADADGPDGMPGTEDDDLRLSGGSPCIDAGDNAAVPEDVLTDLAGRPRFFNHRHMPDTGHGPGPIVDMGAYEYGAGACMDAGDLSVVLCHQPPKGLGRPKTITVDVHEALDHFAHGDTCGACPHLSKSPRRLRAGR